MKQLMESWNKFAISESKYDASTTQISRDVINFLKTTKPKESDGWYDISIMLPEKQRLPVFVQYVTSEEPIDLDVRANFFDGEMLITVIVGYEQSFSDTITPTFVGKLKNVIVYEYEHYDQQIKGGSPIPSYDPEGVMLGDPEEVFKYFSSDEEIEAFISGMYREAKALKVPFKELYIVWFDNVKRKVSQEQAKVIYYKVKQFVERRFPKAILESTNNQKSILGALMETAESMGLIVDLNTYKNKVTSIFIYADESKGFPYLLLSNFSDKMTNASMVVFNEFERQTFSGYMQIDKNFLLCYELLEFFRHAEEWKKSSPSVSNEEPFGKHLFGIARRKNERDTNEEAKIYNILDNWISNGEASPQLTVSIKKLLELLNAGKYNDVLRPDPGIVYRGILVSERFAATKFGNSVFNNVSVKNPFTIIQKPVLYKPKRMTLSSWSYDPKLAISFSSPLSYAGSGTKKFENFVSLIYQANVPSGGAFIFDHKEIPIMKGIGEKEVVSVGDIMCDQVVVVPFRRLEKVMLGKDIEDNIYYHRIQALELVTKELLKKLK
jgi:hypothetical protein